MAIDLNKQKEQLDNLKNKFEDGDNASNLKISNFLTINALSNVITPILKNIFKVDNNINKLIDNLLQSTKTQLSNQGRVEINNGKINFVPIKNQSYEAFRQKFINNVNKIKNRLKILDAKIKVLEGFYKILNITVSILEKKAIAEQILLIIKSRGSQAESTSPSPAKPITGQIIGSEIPKLDQRISKLEGKPTLPIISKNDAIIAVLKSLRDALKSYIPAIKKSYDDLNKKVNNLQLLIGSSPDPETKKLSDEITSKLTTELTERYNNYILKINQLADGSYQVVATDAFSGMKITQTAPSKFLKPDDLFNEIKQILG